MSYIRGGLTKFLDMHAVNIPNPLLSHLYENDDFGVYNYTVCNNTSNINYYNINIILFYYILYTLTVIINNLI